MELVEMTGKKLLLQLGFNKQTELSRSMNVIYDIYKTPMKIKCHEITKGNVGVNMFC